MRNEFMKGAEAALAQYGLDKDAGIRDKLLPSLLAGGLMAGGAAADAARHRPPPIPKPIVSTMIQQPTMNELPNFGTAMAKHTNNLDSILGTR